MKIHNLHSWDVTPQEAREIQLRLATKVRRKGSRTIPSRVAGADISFVQGSPFAWAGVVLLKFPSLEIISRRTLKTRVHFPYIPGLLSFREAPVLLRLFETLEPPPDLIFLDGQGLAHPRRFGLACHLGLLLDCPAVGCAKSRLVGQYHEPKLSKGSTSPLVDTNGEVLGKVVRSRQGIKPLFVSVGHKIDLDTAVRRTLSCTTRYRIPEPTRQAHLLVTEFRKREPL